MRWGSVFMDLTVLPRRWRLKLRNEHGFPHQPAAVRFENQVAGSEPLAIPNYTERCETRRRSLVASCGAASIVTSHRSTVRVSHAIRVWNKPFQVSKSTHLGMTSAIRHYVRDES